MPFIPVATSSATPRSKPFLAKRVVNMYAESDQEGKGGFNLLPFPGWVEFADLGKGPFRGAKVLEGVLYVVSGNDLYSVAEDGEETQIDIIAGNGLVTMERNRNGQLAIVSNTESYVYDVAANLLQTNASLDEDFSPASSVAFLDGYGIYTRRDDDGFFITDINNFKSIDPLDFAAAESQPDKLVRALVDHREVWLIGEETIEIWYNSGASPFPFERITGANMEKGCVAKDSIAKLDNTVFFLGNDNIVYRAVRGTTPVVISEPWITTEIEGFDTTEDAEAFAYFYNGHPFYEITFPSVGKTYVYDGLPIIGKASGTWYEKESYGKPYSRLRGAIRVKEYGNKTIVGDAFSGKLYYLDNDTYTEAGQPHIRTIQTPPIYSPGENLEVNKLELELEPGVGLLTGQGSDPQIMLEVSENGGFTWSSIQTRSLGERGDRLHRVSWNGLGTFVQGAVFRMSVSDPVKFAVSGIYMDIVGLPR